MILKEPPKVRLKNKAEEPTLCLNTGEGRYFLIHRLSHMKKRNPRKEVEKRIKDIPRLTLHSF